MTEKEWNEKYMAHFGYGHLQEYLGEALRCEVVGGNESMPEDYCRRKVTHKAVRDGKTFSLCERCADKCFNGSLWQGMVGGGMVGESMIVMPANNTGIDIGILIGRYPGKIGHLYSPGKNPEPRTCIPYALDNGAFVCWTNKTEFDDDAFRSHLKQFCFGRHKPMWILVPDVVADAKATLMEWSHWEEELRAFSLPLAFAVQDGMDYWDVPDSANLIFVGGTTEWKWKTLAMWSRNFDRVHVGRVNSAEKLWRCHDFGCESCDGTGWFRGDKNQREGLEAYLRESTHGRPRQQPHIAFHSPDVSILGLAREYGPEDER